MSVKVEAILRNTYSDGTTEDHVMAETILVEQSFDDMMKVPEMLVTTATEIAKVVVRGDSK